MRITLLAILLLTSLTAVHAATPDLSKITSRGDLDAFIVATSDAALQQALRENAAAILAAAKQHPHVEAVIRTIETAPGRFAMINTTPESLKTAAGGDIAIFDTLTMVNTGILNARDPHANRDKKTDPYDGAFIEHLGHIPTLENVSIVVTTLDESSLDPLLGLTRLKALRIEKRGGGGLGDTALAKLARLSTLPDLRSLALHYFNISDTGLGHLAGLKNLETFSLRANVPGHAFAAFEGWTNLKSIAFHGNGIDDEGLGHICERFPNLESLNLIHARALTDASAVHLQKLKKLKNIILNGPKMTAAWHGNLSTLPVESLSVSQGNSLPATEAIAGAKAIPTLRRFAMSGKTLTDADLTTLASASQIESLSLEDIDLPDARLPHLQAFAHLKSLTLIRYGKGYPDETRGAVKALLPKVDVKFIQ